MERSNFKMPIFGFAFPLIGNNICILLLFSEQLIVKTSLINHTGVLDNLWSIPSFFNMSQLFVLSHGRTLQNKITLFPPFTLQYLITVNYSHKSLTFANFTITEEAALAVTVV